MIGIWIKSSSLLIEPVWNRNFEDFNTSCRGVREPFNRTSLESKHRNRRCLRTRHPLLIEPVWNRNFYLAWKTWKEANAFNRTSLESKRDTLNATHIQGLSFNRTSLESKLAISPPPQTDDTLLIEPVWNRNTPYRRCRYR